MRIAVFALAMMLSGTSQAAHYPLGGQLETDMRSFQPRGSFPLGFIEYMEKVLLRSDGTPHFNDTEIMLNDLSLPEDLPTQKAPQ
jgi:hypothetical protein